MLAVLLVQAALAAEPTVAVLEDGKTVEGRVALDTSREVLLQVLLDPWRTAETAGSELQVEKLASAGPCTDYRWVVPHPIKTVSYSARLCPTESGVQATLLESEDMAEYRAEWWIEPSEQGVEVRYQLLSTPAFPLPQVVVRSTVKREVKKMLESFQRSLGH